MPIVNLPDGKKMRLPDGMPQEDMAAIVQSYLSQGKPTEPEKPREQIPTNPNPDHRRSGVQLIKG